MNIENLTQKSIECLQNAKSIALNNDNQQIMPEHVLYALLNDENGFISIMTTRYVKAD